MHPNASKIDFTVVLQISERYLQHNLCRQFFHNFGFGAYRIRHVCLGNSKKIIRPVDSTLFSINEGDTALCSYVPKTNKTAILLSTHHYTCGVDMQTGNKKPFAILHDNANKSGVDTIDQMLGTYTCKRSTNRWPLAMFYNIVDIVAFIAYNEMKPIKGSNRRRSFLLVLTKQRGTSDEQPHTQGYGTQWKHMIY
ncbi:uncharacterized protein LOC106095571 isoform X2 [Stomoxys calcitrans]|uniref:uncharacterized protein LOC106095571 isoform X2 n=1 Tax=Stomoxys calcitrans TaxID=35570 RepID=UPI0027E387DC|nr:uncharacterized protein LOC106095571 isoform X2 [Stomoxys calcitrans]